MTLEWADFPVEQVCWKYVLHHNLGICEHSTHGSKMLGDNDEELSDVIEMLMNL